MNFTIYHLTGIIISNTHRKSILSQKRKLPLHLPKSTCLPKTPFCLLVMVKTGTRKLAYENQTTDYLRRTGRKRALLKQNYLIDFVVFE